MTRPLSRDGGTQGGTTSGNFVPDRLTYKGGRKSRSYETESPGFGSKTGTEGKKLNVEWT